MPTINMPTEKTEEEKLRENIQSYFSIFSTLHKYSGPSNHGGKARRQDIDYQSD